MPDPLFGLITPACYDTLLVQRDLLGPAGIDCAKKVVAKLLGTAILFGSFALKLPQIFKILKARSALGLNPTSQYLEASARRASALRPPCSLTPRAVLASPPQIPMYTLSLLYPMLLGYPFSSYGETAVILLQQAVVVALIIAFAEKPPGALAMLGALGAYGGACYALVAVLPPALRPLMPTAAMVFTVMSRLPQCVTNFRQGHTGQLALPTVFLNFGGSVARFFTTLVEQGGDPSMLAGYAVGCALNATLLFQGVYYWRATQAATAAASKKRAD